MWVKSTLRKCDCEQGCTPSELCTLQICSPIASMLFGCNSTQTRDPMGPRSHVGSEQVVAVIHSFLGECLGSALLAVCPSRQSPPGLVSLKPLTTCPLILTPVDRTDIW
jgi:hypothetical protein